MKKMNRKSAAKAARSCITVLLAVIMALPVTAISSVIGVAVNQEPVVAEAADVDLPKPLMTLDFEQGFQGEQEKNGLQVMEFGPRLMFEEYKENNAYVKDSDGNYIFRWTDKPVIYGTSAADYHYEYGVFGNQPVSYDDSEKGNVFRLDTTMEVEEVVKTQSDNMDTAADPVPVYTGGFDADGNPLDQAAYEKSIIQEAMTVQSAVQIKNPFAGKDFSESWSKSADASEGPAWTKGVTISYWVKVPKADSDEGDSDDILNDSVLFTFENIQRPEGVDQTTLDPNGEKVVYGVDGYIKYEAARDYDAGNPMYAQGEEYTLTDINTGTEYKMLKDYGPLVRLTPDYPGSATNKIYFRDDSSSKTADATISIMEGGKPVTIKIYELGPNIYNDFKSLNTNEGSLVPRGYINGSMQIAASDTFHFQEDDYTTETVEDENGNPISTPVKGPFNINPNMPEDAGKITQFRFYNMFYFEGDGRVTEAPDEWHYVTCVIQNDWVQFYVDGEEIEADELGYHGTDFNTLNAKKYFNKGFGARWPYHLGWTNVADWIKDGTFTSGPSNCVPQTMLEWISDPDTVLYIGNQGCAAKSVDQEIGTLDGVLLDDIKFYEVPLTSEQAVALYKQSKDEFDAVANAVNVPAPIKTLNFENDNYGEIPSGMTSVSSNDTNKVTLPDVVNEAEYGKVLKLHTSKSATTGAVKFDNPFAGKTLSGATVSYWVKSVGNAKNKIEEGLTITFVDEPKVLVHNKIQAAVKDVASRTGLWANNSSDAMFQAGVNTQVYESLKNHYQQSTKKNGNTDSSKAGYDKEADQLQQEWDARLASMSEWHHVVMVMENSGIYMYFDGVKLSNNLADDMGPSFYGPRFFDGYYHKYLDSFSGIRYGTSNQGATPLMTFLTQADTAAYFGFMYRQGSSTTYRTTFESYIDDVNFYDVALNDKQVEAVYQTAQADAAAKSPDPNQPIDQPDERQDPTPEPSEDPDPDLPPTTVVVSGDFKDNGDGTSSATANGVTVTGPTASIPKGAVLLVSILGTQDAAASYTAANAALKGAGIDVDSQVITLYDIHIEVDGKTITPTAEFTITLTPPSGYTASKASIVRMSDVKSMSTSVSGSSLVYKTDSLGQFAIMQKKNASVSGSTNPSKSGSSAAGKTGDAASVAVPFALLTAAFCAIVILRRKEETLED